MSTCLMRRTPSYPKSVSLLAKEKLMMDAQPIIPVETGAVNWVKKPYVKGMYPNAGSLFHGSLSTSNAIREVGL